MFNNELFEYFTNEVDSTPGVSSIDENEDDDVNYSKWMKLIENKKPMIKLIDIVKSTQFDGTEIFLNCELDEDHSQKSKGKCDNDKCKFDRCLISNLINHEKVNLCNHTNSEYTKKCTNRIFKIFTKKDNKKQYKDLHKAFSKDVLDRSDSWKDKCFVDSQSLRTCLKSNFDSIKKITNESKSGMNKIFSDVVTKRIKKIINNKKKCDKTECPIKKCVNNCTKQNEEKNELDRKYKELIRSSKKTINAHRIKNKDKIDVLKNKIDILKFNDDKNKEQLGLLKKMYENDLKNTKTLNLVWIYVLGIAVIVLLVIFFINKKPTSESNNESNIDF